MKKLALIGCCLLSFLFVEAQEETATEEVAIYNQFLNELYNVGDCQRFINPPFYACCNFNQHLSVEDHVACCESSEIPERFRIYCQECINTGELDTLTSVIEVSDTLYPLDFEEYKDWILENVHTSSGFYGFINDGVFTKEKIHFDISRLKQQIKAVTIINKDDKKKDYSQYDVGAVELQFMTEKEIKEINNKRPFGKVTDYLMLGRIGLSRVYFNSSNDKAFFYFAFLGNENCGKEQVVLIEKNTDQWEIALTIELSEL